MLFGPDKPKSNLNAFGRGNFFEGWGVKNFPWLKITF